MEEKNAAQSQNLRQIEVLQQNKCKIFRRRLALRLKEKYFCHLVDELGINVLISAAASSWRSW